MTLSLSGLGERLQRSEQYFTWSQSRAHFLRQAKGRWQLIQIFSGKFSFAWAIKRASRNSLGSAVDVRFQHPAKP